MDKTKTEQKTETKRKPTLQDSLGPNNTIEKDIPENVEWIDDAFYIKKTRFGLYTSILKDPLVLTLSLGEQKMEYSRLHGGILSVFKRAH